MEVTKFRQNGQKTERRGKKRLISKKGKRESKYVRGRRSIEGARN